MAQDISFSGNLHKKEIADSKYNPKLQPADFSFNIPYRVFVKKTEV